MFGFPGKTCSWSDNVIKCEGWFMVRVLPSPPGWAGDAIFIFSTNTISISPDSTYKLLSADYMPGMGWRHQLPHCFTEASQNWGITRHQQVPGQYAALPGVEITELSPALSSDIKTLPQTSLISSWCDHTAHCRSQMLSRPCLGQHWQAGRQRWSTHCQNTARNMAATSVPMYNVSPHTRT